jgi:hypothetical protein
MLVTGEGEGRVAGFRDMAPGTSMPGAAEYGTIHVSRGSAMDHADLELKGYHSKCYRGLRARGDGLLRYIDQGFASKQSSLETADNDKVSVLSKEPGKRTKESGARRREEEDSQASEDSRTETRVSKSSSSSSKSARKTMPIDELLVSLHTYTFKKVCKIVLEAERGDEISTKAWDMPRAWQGTLPGQTVEGLKRVVSSLGWYNWINKGKMVASGRADIIRPFGYREGTETVKVVEMLKAVEAVAYNYGWSINFLTQTILSGATLSTQKLFKFLQRV